jgi:predicted exporter
MNKAVLSFALYALAAAGAFLYRPPVIKTDIMDIAPIAQEDSDVAETLSRLFKAYTNRVNVRFGAEDLKDAVGAGVLFMDALAGQPLKVNFLLDKDEAEALATLSGHSHRLLSDAAAELLEAGKYREVRDNALAMLYSPASVGLLPLAQDPFFLFTDFVMNMGLTESNFFPRQGVLSASRDGVSYAYMSLELGGFSPAYLLPVAKEIGRAESETARRFRGVSINVSGVPLHSARAISESAAETNLIAGASMLLVFLISYAIFGSGRCFLFALLTIGVSIALAFMLTSLAFGEIHILVPVFGASLIGVCIDYHIHYFAERGLLEDPWPNIAKPLGICLATTVAGFAVMAFSGVPILLQMAVFAIFGLLNTYAIIRFLYPNFLKNAKIRAIPPWAVQAEGCLRKAVTAAFRKHFFFKVALILVVSAAGVSRIEFGDDLKNLYKPEKDLLAKEAFFAEISGIASMPVMLVVKGGSEQEVLEKEEALRRALGDFSYRAITQAVPSLAKQERNYALVQALYENELDAYLATIGNPPGMKARIMAGLLSQKDIALTPDEAPKALKPLHGEGSSVIVIENPGDKAKLSRIAREGGARYSDRFQEISLALKMLRERATWFLLITCALVFCAIAAAYRSFAKAFAIVAPSLLAVLIALGALGFVGARVSLFHVLALLLVVYLGADYAVFRAEGQRRGGHSGAAVALSCLTSVVSFGALGLTSFAVTKALGATLCLGLTISYLLSPLATAPLWKEAD